MKSVHQWIFLMAVFSTLSGPARAAQDYCSPLLPQDVCALQKKVYLETDYQKTDAVRDLIVGSKEALMRHHQDSQAVQAHILGLYDHALERAHQVRTPESIFRKAAGKENFFGIYDELTAYWKANGPIVPMDWSLPQEIKYFVVDVNRNYDPESDRTQYNLQLYGWLNDFQSIEQVQVIRYPNEVILDRQAGVGNWDETVTGAPTASFGFRTEDRKQPAENGLYLLQLKPKNKPVVKGWFILSQTASSSTPIVHSPAPEQHYTTDQPNFKWTNFHSPEYRSFEHRKRMINVYSDLPGPKDSSWGNSQVYADNAETVTSGPLSNGAYGVNVRFEERWWLGDLMIARSSKTRVSFDVKK